MICPNCRSEIGTMAECPYCGTNARTIPVFSRETATDTREKKPGNGGKQGNMETWQLMTVALLAGIFVLQVLQLIFLVIR